MTTYVRDRADGASSAAIADALGIPVEALIADAAAARTKAGMFASRSRSATPVARPTRPHGNGKSCASHPILNVIGKVNGLANTNLGLIAAAASYAAGKIAGTHPSFGIGNNAIQLTNSPLNIHKRAYTLGNVQIYGTGQGPDRDSLSYTGVRVNNGAHEAGHSNQSQILGPLYLPAEAVGSLFGNRNPLETGADRFARGLSCSAL